MRFDRFVLVLLGIVIGASCWADVPANSFAKYQSIVAKSPFKKFNSPNAAATQPIVGTFALAAHIFGGGVKKVLLKDTKTNKSYWVSEGDTVEDYHVDKIDEENQTVTLSHGADSDTLAYPVKAVVSAPSIVSRPAYRGLRSSLPASAPPPVVIPPPAVIPAPASAASNEGAPSPPTLRRRILRQNQQNAGEPPAAADAPAAENPPPAEEAPAAQ